MTKVPGTDCNYSYSSGTFTATFALIVGDLGVEASASAHNTDGPSTWVDSDIRTLGAPPIICTSSDLVGQTLSVSSTGGNWFNNVYDGLSIDIVSITH